MCFLGAKVLRVLSANINRRSNHQKPATAQAHLETVDELARSGLAEAQRSVAGLRPKLLEEGELNYGRAMLPQVIKSMVTALLTTVSGTS